jgi:hypothetical protein
MTATVFGKWYWSDWMSDPGVRASSYAARGLWMDLLCIAATADPTGYVVLNGRPLTASDIARLTGGDASEVEILLDELDRNGVFTRDRHGRIYSRRMLREAKRTKISRQNGKKGGNPTLRTQRENSARDNPPVNPGDKPEDKTQKPEARNQLAKASSASATRMRVVEAFKDLAPNRLPPDTNRVVIWLEQGYEPDLIVAVIREVLPRKPDVGSLVYFDKALSDAKSKRASTAAYTSQAPPEPRIDFGNGVAWPRSSVEKVVAAWIEDPGRWPESALGPPPGSPGCRVPPDLLPQRLH